MHTRWYVASFLALGVAGAAGMVTVAAQSGRAHDGTILVPDSSREHADDHGLRAHTNHVIHLRGASPAALTPGGETPQSVRPYYLPGVTAGGSGVIAIVDAYDYPTALADFNTFSTQFGLPTEPSTNVTANTNQVFQVMYGSGKKPRGNCGWNQEAALDIEWAHAMAPKAKIILIESTDSSFASLLQAVDLANSLQVSQNIANMQVSMSWGGSEFSSESNYDTHFSNPTIAYFAASGDTGGQTIYPSVSPYVISAGGTSLQFSGNAISGETGWTGSGGGPSKYESRPAFQNAIATIVGQKRGTPDFSFDADPKTGVSVYDTTRCQGISGWMVFGGTSVSSPALAGIINLVTDANHALGSGVLPTMYADFGGPNYLVDFHDVKAGTAGSYTAKTGWDFVTGIGSNLGLYGK